MASDWTIADGISDEIVNIVNRRLAEMQKAGRIQPFQLLAGQLLALMALFSTMPPSNPADPSDTPPDALVHLQLAVTECLELLKSLPAEA